MTAPRLLANALIPDAAGRPQPGAILIEGDTIADIARGALPGAPEGAETIDCGGRLVLPGLIDGTAFTGEPGAEHRETLATASRAAAAGGVTTIICRSDTHPPIDDPAIVDFVMRRARDTSVVRIHPMAALTKGVAGRELTEIGLMLEAGAIAFGDGPRSIANAQVMRRALIYAADFGALIVHHTEDRDLVGDGVMNEGELASRFGLMGIPKAAETIMLERDIRLVRATGGRYHAALVTTAESLKVIERAKADGLSVTASTSINHLALNENDVTGYRTFCKLSPPLRDEDDRQALLAAVESGVIDTVVSDHDPQDVETKRLPFAEAANGAVGVETLLVAALRLHHAGDLSLAALIRALSARPAEVFGLAGGRIAAGAPADLVVIDPDAPFVLDPATLRSKSKNTPFDGARFQGVIQQTIVAGKTVYGMPG